MKTTLLSVGMLLALAGCGNSELSTSGAAGSAPATAAATSAQAPAATAFADSVAALPGAPADVAAGRAYAQSVSDWYGSELGSGIKEHPLATGIWQNYRAVIRKVITARSLKKFKPGEEAKIWDKYTPQCEQLAKMLVPLTQDKPAPTSDKAVPQMQMVWDGMQHVRLNAEREMSYLEPLAKK
ncbi:hypothetical protein [Hymenobacter sp. HDW8]|uniref:hypothetical protein n=1 Tax=Hymenobacter sp. HDW8 TaxID=2714932 RepID=UPI0014090D70|nr:hypothetical protein [Hymenobacter sp. HDW8]QIL78420.1 hypothetical protein G7064_21605 [Hymenobacter sp. HDW8]